MSPFWTSLPKGISVSKRDASMKESAARRAEADAPQLYETLADVFDFADPELWKANSFAALRPRLTPHVRTAIAKLEFKLAYEIGRSRSQPFCGFGATKEHRQAADARRKAETSSAIRAIEARLAKAQEIFWPPRGAFTMIVLGLDPGAHGAVAMLDETGELLAVEDMPFLPEASGRVATKSWLDSGLIRIDRQRPGKRPRGPDAPVLAVGKLLPEVIPALAARSCKKTSPGKSGTGNVSDISFVAFIANWRYSPFVDHQRMVPEA
jgi:hypothetical protein